jgi:hypothetical protein
MRTVKMYCCQGWQNVRDYSDNGIEFPVSIEEISAENAHAVMSYTHGRNTSLKELLKDLKEEAGVKKIKYKVE